MHTKRVLLILMALAAPTQATAQRISSPYKFVEKKKDLGLFAAYILADQGAAGLGPKDGPAFGAEFNIRLSDPIIIAFLGAYFSSERNVVDPAAEDEALRILGVADQDLLLLTGRLKLHLTGSRTWRNLVPFLYGGLGIAIDVTGLPSCFSQPTQANCQLAARERFDFGTKFVGQFGLGLIWLPRQRLGLRFTFDDSIWKLNTPDGFYDETSTLFPVPSSSDWTNNLVFTAGLYFWF